MIEAIWRAKQGVPAQAPVVAVTKPKETRQAQTTSRAVQGVPEEVDGTKTRSDRKALDLFRLTICYRHGTFPFAIGYFLMMARAKPMNI